MPKDYYATLGVSKSASQDEIKAAFRKMAHQHHPDKPSGNAEKFKEINEAYQVVGDAEKRKKYDQFGSAAFDGSAGGGGGNPFGGGFGGFDFSGGGFSGEDLGEMFGDMFGFGGRSQGRSRPQGSDVQIDLELSFKEAVFGVEKEVSLTKKNACDRCGGNGGEPGTGMQTCADCEGKGVKVISQRTILGNIQSRVTCTGCAGTGEVPKKPCTTCHGDGVTRSKKTLSISVPGGVDDGAMLRVRGGGEAVKGGPAGDLYVRLHVEQDERFQREGADIYSEVKIGFTQAALGADLKVDTVDGKESLTIPHGTQSGTHIRIRGKGVPHRGKRGDHVVIVTVVTPTHLSRDQKKKLEELGLTE